MNHPNCDIVPGSPRYKSAFITVLGSVFNQEDRSPSRSNTEVAETAYGRTLGEPWLAMT